MNDLDAKINLSKKLAEVKSAGFGPLENVLRSIIYAGETNVNWDRVAVKFQEQYPEESNV